MVGFIRIPQNPPFSAAYSRQIHKPSLNISIIIQYFYSFLTGRHFDLQDATAEC